MKLHAVFSHLFRDPEITVNSAKKPVLVFSLALRCVSDCCFRSTVHHMRMSSHCSSGVPRLAPLLELALLQDLTPMGRKRGPGRIQRGVDERDGRWLLLP